MCKGNGLSAILRTCHLSNDLSCDIASRRKRVWLFDHDVADNCAILQHIFQIDQIAIMKGILAEVVNIMEVDNAIIVSLDNIRRKQHSLADILAFNTGHIVTLSCNQHCVFIGVFIVPVFAFTIQQLNDGIVSRVFNFALEFANTTVSLVSFSGKGLSFSDQLFKYH